METIYTGKEPLLVETLIEKTIEEHKINVFEIAKITVDCYMPKDNDQMHLWTICIRINMDYTSYFYSKDCIRHGYSITYLQHLVNMGVKKINLMKMVNNNGKRI